MRHIKRNRVASKRVQFSAIAQQTHNSLLIMMAVACGVLFVFHLFLMNHVMIKGMLITNITRDQIKLKGVNEQLDAQIAKLQTQEFVGTASEKNNLVFREVTHRYVVVPNETYTAQK